MSNARRTTVRMDPELHRALRIKAAETDESVSNLVNRAVRQAMAEDADDLHDFRTRGKEPDLDFDSVLKQLRRRGKQ